MMFDGTDTLKGSAEYAFSCLLSDRDDVENMYTYVTNELNFTKPTILNTLESYEVRAKEIMKRADDTKPVGSLADAFESESMYLQSSDMFDSETDFINSYLPNINNMLVLFEQLVK